MSGERYEPGPVPFDPAQLAQYVERELRRIASIMLGFLQQSVTYDAPSLADAAGTTTTVSVPGAELGDFAEASFSLNLQGITVTAWVSAADVVSVRLQNETGGTIDLASGTLRARVERR